MGKFILCTGVQAKTPFHFTLTNTNIYSMDELCYYLYNNIYTVTEDTFNMELVQWLYEEVEMEVMAVKLQELIQNKNDIKDIVVSILCSTDYYAKEEIEELIVIIDKMNDLTPIGKQKIKADNFLKYKKYPEAALEYESILAQEEASKFKAEEFGNILHNLAIAHIHTLSLQNAAIEFKKAYALNQNEESLKQYLFALKLTKQEKKFADEIAYYEVTPEKASEYSTELEDVLLEAEQLPAYKKVQKLPKLKEDGKVGEYYYSIDTMIFNWKQQYKRRLE